MTSPYAEWGYAIGSAYLLIFGLLIGMSYRSFTLGRLAGVMTYPIFFTGLLELPRGLYWPLGRVTPAWLARTRDCHFRFAERSRGAGGAIASPPDVGLVTRTRSGIA